MKALLRRLAITALAAALLASCAGKIATPQGQQCADELRRANQELEDAKVRGFGGTIQWIKAAGLLTEANAQMQVEHFDGCLDRVQRARIYLREAQK
jgi:hypothetical protein